MRLAAAITLAGLLVSASPAQAGRTPYAWLEDVETVPERGVELESWVAELDRWTLAPSGAEISATRVGWAATLGLTDRVELRLPVEWGWYEGSGTQLDQVGGELRWRLAEPDPLEAPPVVSLVRLRAARFVTQRGVYRVEPGAVVSAALGRVRLTADAGLAVDLSIDGDATLVARGGLGVSVGLTDDLRAGAELAGELGDPDQVAGWTAAGPSVGYTHGRTWLAAGVLLGLTRVGWAPRLDWGIAF